jgi:ABC-type phosphate/phosphonate transport system substrate-binding protein
MIRATFVVVLLTSVLLLRVDARPAVKPLRLGVAETVARGMSPGLLNIVMRPFKSYLEGEVGKKGEITQVAAPLELAKLLHEEKIEIGVFFGHEFARAKVVYPRLQPIVVCVGRPKSTNVVLLVNRSKRIREIAGLEGKIVAMPIPNKAYCTAYFEHLKINVKDIHKPLDSEEALDSLSENRVEGVVIEEAQWEDYQTTSPSRANNLKVLQTSESFPPGVIATYEGRMSDSELKKFREALIRANGSTKGKGVLTTMQVSSFQIPVANFDDILAQNVKTYPGK